MDETSMAGQEKIKPGFLDRKVRLRWPLYFIGLLILAGLVLYGVNAWQMAGVRGDARDMLRDEIRLRGEDLARTIAVTSRDDIINGNFDKLQDYAANIVKQQDIQYIIIMKPNGNAVVHTNSKLRGTVLKDGESRKALKAMDITSTDILEQELYDVAAPVMDYTKRTAVVRVGISYSKANHAFVKNTK